MDLHIETAVPDDYDAIIECWTLAGLSYRPMGRDSPSNMKRLIRDGADVVLIVRHGGRIIATLVVTRDGRKGWINRLAVVPEHRGKGIATALVERFEEIMKAEGHPVVLCALVEDWNRGSMDFFEGRGYVLDHSVKYYSKRDSPDV